MISSHTYQLSVKQQIMIALAKGRSKKLRDKKHSKSHRANSARKKTENLKSEYIKQFILEARARMSAFHFTLYWLALQRNIACVSVCVFF